MLLFHHSPQKMEKKILKHHRTLVTHPPPHKTTICLKVPKVYGSPEGGTGVLPNEHLFGGYSSYIFRKPWWKNCQITQTNTIQSHSEKYVRQISSNVIISPRNVWTENVFNDSHPKTQRPSTTAWAVIKTLVTFHHTGWLIGILIIAYYNPHIVG